MVPVGERQSRRARPREGHEPGRRRARRPRALAPRGGYGVLAFDLRGHGESDGDRFSLGQHERKDVAAAVEHVLRRGIASERIALVGLSMGAGTTLQSVRSVRVGAAVADSAYANGTAIVDEASPGTTGFPPVFTPGIVLAARVLLGIDADAVDPDRAVAATATPILFIHCDDDPLIGPHHSRALHAARPGNELWIVAGCGHAAARTVDPAAYDARVAAFLDRHLR